VKTETEFDWNRTFTGQVWDSETGLMLYRNRYYNIILGRFINRDPIEYEGKDINLFRYVYNIPVIAVDTTGQCFAPALPWITSIIVGIGTIISAPVSTPIIVGTVAIITVIVVAPTIIEYIKTKPKPKPKKLGICFCFNADTPDFSQDFFKYGTCQSQADCLQTCISKCQNYKSALCSFN
jgi:RHS repeat-associated protein